jgi:hypothetical protein
MKRRDRIAAGKCLAQLDERCGGVLSRLLIYVFDEGIDRYSVDKI